MKSPVKDLRSKYLSIAYLRELIPRGSVSETYLFYSGQVEFGLASHGRFICAHTTNQPIYEFWQCLAANSRRLYDIITCPAFKVEDDNMFHILQETWPKLAG